MYISKLLHTNMVVLTLGIASAIPAQAQSCPCDLSLNSKELSRSFMFCGGSSFDVGIVDWAGTRNIQLFKAAKGGKEYGSVKKVISIGDWNPGTGDNELGDHVCEVASGYSGKSGSPRNVNRSSVTSFEEWTACRDDLVDVVKAVANTTNDPYDSCIDTDGDDIPDHWDSPWIEEPIDAF